ncbi:hypothetical protein J6590_075426 [Homalodisca vitripennis]|nr:hypothetical protein J6590_075426 [Homalodisca vitripennis]
MTVAGIDREPQTGVYICTVTIYKISPHVRQLRITFEHFQLAGPVNGNCVIDRFVVTGQNRNDIIPPICGFNTGKHIHLDVDETTGPVSLTLLSSGAYGIPKNFKVRVTQLKNDSPLLAPNNCLQFYTEPQGSVESFNYSPFNSTTSIAPGYFNNLNYAICFKKTDNFCGIVYSNVAAGGMEFDFEIVNKEAGKITQFYNQTSADDNFCRIVYSNVAAGGMEFDFEIVNKEAGKITQFYNQTSADDNFCGIVYSNVAAGGMEFDFEIVNKEAGKITQFYNQTSADDNFCRIVYSNVAAGGMEFDFEIVNKEAGKITQFYNQTSADDNFCGIVYSNVAAGGMEFDFEIVNKEADGTDTVPEGQAGAERFDCPDDYIVISGTRLCGYKFNDGSILVDFSKNYPVTGPQRDASTLPRMVEALL